jgi:AraC-like DNA-binding protein
LGVPLRGVPTYNNEVLRHRQPGPPLSAFVDLIWHYRMPPAPHRFERILPSGDMSIVVNLTGGGLRAGDETFPGALVCGAFSEYFTIDIAQQAYTLGIHFKPGGAAPFLKLPAGELEGRHVALDDVWGADAAELHDKLLHAGSAEMRFDLVERVLRQRLGARDPHPATAYALREIEGEATVADLADRIGLSAKRLADVFRADVGLTPKRYRRVRRFQRALRRLNEGKQVDWADFALDCGYYDQPHFIRDFQAFSGLNPSSYTPRSEGYLNHVALD